MLFQGYLDACAMPRAIERKKFSRKVARESPLLRATRIPIGFAAEIGRGLKLAQAVERLVDASLPGISDLEPLARSRNTEMICKRDDDG